VCVLAALSDPPDPALPEALRVAVAAMAGRWAARTASPGRAFVSTKLPGAAVDGTTPFDEPDREQLAAAIGVALSDHDGPLVLVASDVPRLDDRLADAALGDLAAGCALSFAPATDARPCLLALAGPDPRLLALLTAGDRRDEVLAAALELGGEVGLLRSERRVVTPGDARALALDPLVPPELRRLAGP
jgi:hypothetical protein